MHQVCSIYGLNLLFAPQGHSAASVMCKCSREGEKSSSWRGHRGTACLPSFLPSCKAWNTCRWAAKAQLPDCYSKTLHLPQRPGESRKIPGIVAYCYLFPHFSVCRGFSKAGTDSDFGDLQHGVVTHLTARCVPGAAPLQSELGQDLKQDNSNRILRSNVFE